MITLNWYVLLRLDIVYTLQYGKPMPNTRHSHLLQIVMLQSNQGLADNFVFYPTLAGSKYETACSKAKAGAYPETDRRIAASPGGRQSRHIHQPSIPL